MAQDYLLILCINLKMHSCHLFSTFGLRQKQTAMWSVGVVHFHVNLSGRSKGPFQLLVMRLYKPYDFWCTAADIGA